MLGINLTRIKVSYHIIIIAFLFIFSACEKDGIFIPDNEPIDNTYISTLQVENYINRIFIDLIGREPLDAEMTLELANMQNGELSESARRTLIEKLQQDQTVIPGDSTYKRAYYYRFYDIVKARMIEGVENDYLAEDRNTMSNSLNGAIASGDSAEAAYLRDQIYEINAVFSIPNNYMHDSIGVQEIFYRMIDNYVYDIINMNTFNFINATFYDLFYRFPTQQEYGISFEMIENNVSGNIVGLGGASRGDYMEIMTSSSQFYEGLIIWAYQSLVVREPAAAELQYHMSYFPNTKDFQELQVQIMMTNEYANF
ncbi:MAG: hypothetical protein ACI9O4_001490 [Chitinophagales bacterium]